MQDAALLLKFDWSPSSLDDIDDMPDRVLWLYGSYRSGVYDRAQASSG